jgi:hypothetical protein
MDWRVRWAQARRLCGQRLARLFLAAPLLEPLRVLPAQLRLPPLLQRVRLAQGLVLL